MKDIERTTKIRSFLEAANTLFNSKELNELIEKYNDLSHYPKSNHVHNIVTGSAVKLVDDVINRGGTEEEVNCALKYMIVCINSKKYMLNVKKYAKENGVWDLRRKYQPWRIKTGDPELVSE